MKNRVPLARAVPLAFGNTIHAGLEEFWICISKHKSIEDCTAESVAALRNSASRDGLNEYETYSAVALMAGYAQHWYGWASQQEVIHVEKEFNVPVIQPGSARPSQSWRMSGKIDVILRLADRRVAMVEHKTSGQYTGEGSQYQRKLIMDPQVSIYWQAMDLMGEPCDVCIYDILQKPDLEPKRATPQDKLKTKKNGEVYARQRVADETFEEFSVRVAEKIASNMDETYKHIRIYRLDGEIDRSALDIWHGVWSINDSLTRGYFPRNPDSCHDFGRECDYSKVCSGVSELDDQTLFKSQRAHIELSAKE